MCWAFASTKRRQNVRALRVVPVTHRLHLHKTDATATAFLPESRLHVHTRKGKGNEQQAGSGRWAEERLLVLFKGQGVPTEGFSTGEGVSRDFARPTPSIHVPLWGKKSFPGEVCLDHR